MSSNSARGGGRSESRRRSPLVARRPAGPEPETPPPAPAAPPPRPRPPPGLSPDDGEWMSSRRAAEVAGVSVDTVRDWRKAGTIAERGKGAGLQVFLTADHRARAAPGTGADGAPHSELGVLVPLEVHQRSLAELILRLTDTTERAVRAETELEFLRERLSELERSS